LLAVIVIETRRRLHTFASSELVDGCLTVAGMNRVGPPQEHIHYKSIAAATAVSIFGGQI